ncbi:GH3 auxin-responsive promoter family protein [Chloroflexota bacterium]
MPKAVELLKQGRNEELWQACCGFISLSLEQFMAIQKRLLLEQIALLNRCELGNRIMRGEEPESVEEFRQLVPLTTYASYCPELIEKREDILPAKPALWVRTSGRSGEYPCRWVPMSPVFSREMSTLMYGLGIFASCHEWGNISMVPERPKVVYTVAPRPYVSGAMASMLEQQTPVDFMPPMELAESLPFEERVKLGFKQALSQGLEYFFGLSLILAAVGDKFSQSSEKVAIRPLLSQPRALLRLAKGLAKSKLAGRPMLPRDLWSVKGIISSGLDSWVYRDKIKKLWGRYPLDAYTSTEGGIIATQTWDYDSMTFIPNLNFLEFIPESEHLRWQLDHGYQPRTVLLDEVRDGENYEIVITNFHGGALVRYRIGDMVRITSLRNAKLGINLPQMVFERRTDDILYFTVVKLTEKIIWQAVERTGIAYEDWAAYKKPGEQVLHLLIEPKSSLNGIKAHIAASVQEQILDSGKGNQGTSGVIDDWKDTIDFSVEVTLLPTGAFANYTAQKQAEGADLAHLKPPHLNPSEEVLSILLAKSEEIIPAAEAGQVPVR